MRRFAKRDLRSDEGLGLVETVVALLVFSLIMTGLAASMMTFAHRTTITKARAAATALAQRMVEKARAVGYANLQVCDGGGAPSTAQFRGAGTAYPVVSGTNQGCLTYQQNNLVRDGVKFSATQLVLAKPTVNDLSGKPMTELYLIVQLGWSVAGSGNQSYELDTLVRNEGKIAAAPGQGIRFVVNDSTGNVISTDDANWDISIVDTASNVVDSGVTDEGVFSSMGLDVGTYTCKISINDASQSYAPGTNTGKTVDTANGTVSSSCNVTATTVTDWTTAWVSKTDCAATTTKGTLTVSVKDNNETPVSGATVALINVFGHAGTPGNVTTDATGVATFNKTVPGDWYTYTVSKTNYTTTSNNGPVCVVANATTGPAPAVLVPAGCAYSSAKGTLVIKVTDTTDPTPNPISGATVTLTKLTAGAPAAPGAKNTDANGNATFSLSVGGGSYTYTVTKTGYEGSGVQGPICVVVGANNYDEVSLQPPGSTCVRNTAVKGKFAFTVRDQLGNPVNNANISFVNVNGDNTPGDIHTGAAGTVTSPLMVNDPYQYSVTGPSGYRATGALPAICMIGTGTINVSVTLTATMTIIVRVTNNGTLAWKTYSIKLTDPTGSVSSQAITVPNSGTRNPTSATFAGQATGNGYKVEICAQKANGSCDLLAYTGIVNFPTLNTTYTVDATDDKG